MLKIDSKKLKLLEEVKTTQYVLNYDSFHLKLIIKEYPDKSEYNKISVNVCGNVFGQLISIDFNLKSHDHKTIAIESLFRFSKLLKELYY